MRIQKLPKELWTGRLLSDTNTYCYWYTDAGLKATNVMTVKEAYDFVNRAKIKNVAAFASAYVPRDKEHEVINFSPCGILKKYEFVDWVNLSIGRAYQMIIKGNESDARISASQRDTEQWGSKTYISALNPDHYEVSWYTTDKPTPLFKSESFTKFKDALSKFEEFEAQDIPCRLTEVEGKKIHEIKAARQHWFIGMGNYLEQLAKSTLPVGEIPYIFSNQYMSDEMKINGDYGYLDFCVGWESYSIQIVESKVCRKGVVVSVSKGFDQLYYVTIIDNPIINPWLNRIKRGW